MNLTKKNSKEIKNLEMLSFTFPSIVVTDDREQELIDYELKEKEENKQKLFEKSGVPERYFNSRLESFNAYSDELKYNLLEVTKYIANFKTEKKSLWLCGNNGTGKTMLAAIIIRELGGMYTTSFDIADKIKDTFSYSANRNREAVTRDFLQNGILVIDEVTKFQSDFEKECLFKILYKRYDKKLETILISNTDERSLKMFLGKALYDRFCEGGYKVLKFTGESYRRRGI